MCNACDTDECQCADLADRFAVAATKLFNDAMLDRMLSHYGYHVERAADTLAYDLACLERTTREEGYAV